MSLELSDYSVHLQGMLSHGLETIDLEKRRFGFVVGRIQLLSDPARIAEVISAPQIAPVPNTPIWFRGMVVNHGEMVPVFDIQAMIDTNGTHSIANAITKIGHVVVISEGTEFCALYLNQLPIPIAHTDELVKTHQSPEIPDFLSPAFISFYEYLEKTWCDVNYSTLFHLASHQLAVQMQQAWTSDNRTMIASAERVLIQQRSTLAHDE